MGAGARPRQLDRPRLARRVRRPRRHARRAGDLLRGVRARRRSRARRHHRRGTARTDDRPLRHRRAEAPRSCPASCAAPRSGARATPSPTRAPTSPTCRPAPNATATSGSSPARRCGRRSRTGRNGSSCIARTDREAPKHKGLSYLLVPMDQPGHRDPPDRADHRAQRVQRDVLRRRAHAARRTSSASVDEGWRVAMGTLAFERGASTLGQQLSFEQRAAHDHRARARRTGSRADPSFRQRLADAWITLARDALPRAAHAARCSSTARSTPATSIHKLFWAAFHRGLGELAIDVLRRGREWPAADDGAATACSSTAGPTRSTAARTRSSAT